MADPRPDKDDVQRYADRVLSKKNEDGSYKYPALAAMMEELPDGYDPDEQPSERDG